MTYREQIKACEKKLLQAMKASDVSALEELLHDALLFNTPDGQTITKAMDLEAHRSGNMVVTEISSTIELINIIENTAVVTIIIDTKGSMLGQTIEGKFRYIRVWKLFHDTWKVIAGSCIQV